MDSAARHADLAEVLAANSAVLYDALTQGIGDFADARVRMTGFYLAWVAYRRSGLRAAQNALLAAIDNDSLAIGHPVSDYGGRDLIAAFRSELAAEDSESLVDKSVLLPAYEAADKYTRSYPHLIGFIRLRRTVAIAVLEHLADAEDLVPGLITRIRADFNAERDADPRWTTPQLRAEALSVEARLLCANQVADYDGAARLIAEARGVDQRAEGENEVSFRARLASYEQQLAWVRSLQAVARLRIQLANDAALQADHVEKKMREALDESRKESLQQVGLLAAVVALITSITGSRAGGTLSEAALQIMLTGGVIVLTFSLFSVAFGTHNPRVRWAVAVIGLLLMGLTAVIFFSAPVHARYG